MLRREYIRTYCSNNRCSQKLSIMNLFSWDSLVFVCRNKRMRPATKSSQTQSSSRNAIRRTSPQGCATLFGAAYTEYQLDMFRAWNVFGGRTTCEAPEHHSESWLIPWEFSIIYMIFSCPISSKVPFQHSSLQCCLIQVLFLNSLTIPSACFSYDLQFSLTFVFDSCRKGTVIYD